MNGRGLFSVFILSIIFMSGAVPGLALPAAPGQADKGWQSDFHWYSHLSNWAGENCDKNLLAKKFKQAIYYHELSKQAYELKLIAIEQSNLPLTEKEKKLASFKDEAKIYALAEKTITKGLLKILSGLHEAVTRQWQEERDLDPAAEHQVYRRVLGITSAYFAESLKQVNFVDALYYCELSFLALREFKAFAESNLGDKNWRQTKDDLEIQQKEIKYMRSGVKYFICAEVIKKIEILKSGAVLKW